MNDWVMNITSSISIAIFGGLMAANSLGGGSLIEATGKQAIYINHLLSAVHLTLHSLLINPAFGKPIFAEK